MSLTKLLNILNFKHRKPRWNSQNFEKPFKKNAFLNFSEKFIEVQNFKFKIYSHKAFQENREAHFSVEIFKMKITIKIDRRFVFPQKKTNFKCIVKENLKFLKSTTASSTYFQIENPKETYRLWKNKKEKSRYNEYKFSWIFLQEIIYIFLV